MIDRSRFGNFIVRRRDRGSSGPQVLSLSTLRNSAISSARSMNPFSGKPYMPVFDLRVPDHRVLDRLVAKDVGFCFSSRHNEFVC
jgi:hypothetical protein